MKRRGIALLLTLFFVILFSVALGIGLKSLQNAKKTFTKEQFLLQSNVILEDVLKMLQTSKELDSIVDQNSSSGFYSFLMASSYIPLKSNGYNILISLKSARDKININQLVDQNRSINQVFFDHFSSFLARYHIQNDLVWFSADMMRGILEDGGYYSDIFYKNPTLFRNYIASMKHFEKALIFYNKKFQDNVFSKVDFDKLFLFKKDKNTKVDLNFATLQVWEFMLGCSQERALELVSNGGTYNKLEDLGLNTEEKEQLNKFSYSFLEPIILVDVLIQKEELFAQIEFEYDLKKKKATHFVFEI